MEKTVKKREANLCSLDFLTPKKMNFLSLALIFVPRYIVVTAWLQLQGVCMCTQHYHLTLIKTVHT